MTEAAMECLEKVDDEPIRQGDIFAWLPSSREAPWKEYGVIVTADCDIANRKHAGILSYAPILAISEYLKRLVLSDKIGQRRTLLAERIGSRIRTVQTQLGRAEVVTAQRAASWVAEASADAIVAALDFPEPYRGEVGDSLELYARAGLDPERDSLAEYVAILRDLGMKSNAIVDRITQAIRNPPGDCFFLHAITRGASDGYVAYLRIVREIPESTVAVRQDQLSSCTARRVAKLQSPYVFALTRQLAEVFASVGLPAGYSENQLTFANSLIATIPDLTGAGQ